MKLQSVYRHYWPDTAPYASILRAILEERARLGDDVCVLTGQPSYNDNRLPARPRQEVVGGVRVRRFRLPPERKRSLGDRAGSLLWFLGRAGVAVAAHGSPDLILVNGHPPVGMGFFARAMRRWHGVPYVYHCQDIHPEALLVGGHVRPGRMFRLLRSLDTQTCMGAAAVVVLSDDMRKTMLGRGIPDEKLVVINNFALAADAGDSSDEVAELLQPVPADAFVVLFAGNLGNFQGLDALVEAAQLLAARRDIQFVFMGSGLARERLERAAGDLVGETIHFVGQRSVSVARDTMAISGIGVVSLLPGVCRVAYPSKLMTYVASGCPVLAVVEPDSSVAADVADGQLGYVCGGQTPRAIATAIEHACNDRARWNAAGRAALCDRAEARFGRATALAKWAQLLEAQIPRMQGRSRASEAQ